MYASFSFSRPKAFSFALGLGLLGLAGSITIYYNITKDPLFHQIAYAILTATIVFHSMWVMESQLRPSLKARDAEKASQTLRTMWIMVATGLTIFLGGYLVWLLDNEFCSQARRLRRAIGLPWAVLLEGHAWWHLMTGLAYYYIVWGIWLRHCLNNRDDEYALHWPKTVTSIPEVRRVKDRGPKQQ
ncbi:hypothetical protein FDECE_18413 [Fusarium decemcellulare]|nr:hypothetical protein FDECE_18413 [Fusarium decemcellulare]